MNNEDIKSKINDFLVEEFEIDQELINPDAKLKDDLGLDSLDFVDVVVEIEDVFGIKLTGADFTNIVFLSDFYNLIIKKLK
jgi:acyl carrier protein